MDFKSEQNRVLAEGAKQRGEFSPREGSAPLRAYNYYVSKGGHVPTIENFCHFWRVVVIWAPLYALYYKVLKPFSHSAVGRGLGKVFASPVAGAAKLEDAYRSHAPQKVQRVLPKVFLYGLLGVLVVAVISLVGIGMAANWLATLAVMSGVVGFMGAIIGISHIVDKKEAERQEKRRALMERYYRGEIDYPFTRKTKTKEPGRVKVAIQNVKEFMILLVQIIRVKKWKICPIVQIPTSD